MVYWYLRLVLMMRVLIVDDSTAMQHILRRGLISAELTDIEIRLASNGLEALEAAKQWAPNLILSDWHMPEMTGLALLQAINREMPDIKVGFVTTETSDDRIREAHDAGVQFVINKPFTVETLHRVVLPVLEQIRTGATEVARPEGAIDTDVDASEESRGDVAQPISKPVVVNFPGVEALEEAINRVGSREVFMEAIDTISFTKGSLPGLLVLFSAGASTKIRVIVILDLSAACILGGSFLNMNEEKVQKIILQGVMNAEISNSCERMFERLCGEQEFSSLINGNRLNIMRFSKIPKISPKLEAMLLTPAERRINCDLAAIGYGQGNMIILLSR